MRIPFIKFQNPNLFVLSDACTHPYKPIEISPFNFFKVGCIKNDCRLGKEPSKRGVLHMTITLSEEEFDLICLPHSLREDIYHAYHTDPPHQGRDKTLSMIKRRSYSPRLANFIKQRMQTCGCCIRRKTVSVKSAELVNITSAAPMELICID